MDTPEDRPYVPEGWYDDQHVLPPPKPLTLRDHLIAAVSLPSLILLPIYFWLFAFEVHRSQAGALGILLNRPLMLLLSVPAFITGLITHWRVTGLSVPGYPFHRYRSKWEATLMFCGMMGMIGGTIGGMALSGRLL